MELNYEAYGRLIEQRFNELRTQQPGMDPLIMIAVVALDDELRERCIR